MRERCANGILRDAQDKLSSRRALRRAAGATEWGRPLVPPPRFGYDSGQGPAGAAMARKTAPPRAGKRPPSKGRRRPLSQGRHKGSALSALRTALDILREIQQGADATRQSIAQSLGISTKQVARYLAVLQEAGVDFALDERGDPAPNLRIESAIRVSDVPFNAFNLTRDELLLLYANLSGIHHAGDDAQRRRLWDKARRHLSAAKVDAAQIASALGGFQKAYKSHDTPERRAVISALLHALYLNRACTVAYRAPNAGEPKRYPVEPYEMVEFDGGLYLYCHQPYHKNVLLLAVERIAALEVTDEEFPRRGEIEEEIRRKQARA